MRKRLLFSSIALFFIAIPAFAQGKLESIDVHRPLPSTALILTRNALGSGFLVDRQNGLVLTNYHVVEENGSVDVLFPAINNLKAIVSKEYYFKKAPRIQGRVIARDPLRDLAAVQLAVPYEVPELPLAKESPRPGDATSMVGNPGDATRVWVWAPGEVKELKQVRIQYATGQRVQAMTSEVLADPKFGPGTSGGPAVNTNGELIGVMAAQKTREPMRKLYIDITEVRFFLGVTYRGFGTGAMNQRDYGRAIGFFTKAIDTNADPLSYNERGVAYSFVDRLDDAIADYSQAIKLDPKLPRVWRNRGSAYLSKGKYEQAVADCNEAIRLDPKYARAYLTRSRAYAKLGKTDESQTDYRQAVQLDGSLK